MGTPVGVTAPRPRPETARIQLIFLAKLPISVLYQPVYAILGPSLDKCFADSLKNVGKRVFLR